MLVCEAIVSDVSKDQVTLHICIVILASRTASVLLGMPSYMTCTVHRVILDHSSKKEESL